MNTIAIIPARGGSKGVPKKNIALLGGYPLIAYSIAAAKLSTSIDRTIVSTDSPEIAEIGKSFGAEIPFLRPAALSKDTSSDLDFVLHAINWLETHERKIPQYIVHLRPTTPLRDPKIIDNAINLILKSPQATSLRSGHPASESPFKWFLLNSQGYFQGISSKYSTEYINKPRQSFPQVFIPDGYVDVLKTLFIKETNILHGENMLGFISPPCHEIDSREDFKYLEFELLNKPSILLNYLNQNFSSSGAKNV